MCVCVPYVFLNNILCGFACFFFLLNYRIYGVTSGFADYALVLVNSRQSPNHMTRHHLNLCSSFNIPIIIVFTKIDDCPKHVLGKCEQEVLQLLRLPGIAKHHPFAVQTVNDLARVVDKITGSGGGGGRGSRGGTTTVAPMIHISCVTGEGIELLQKLLFVLPKRRRHASKTLRKFEFLVDQVFDVPNVGVVVAGFVNAGELSVGISNSGRSPTSCRNGNNSNSNNSSNSTTVYIGPTDDDGSFLATTALSAHIARINTTHITAGQSATLALDSSIKSWQLRRGMVVLSEPPGPLTFTRQFEAEICVLQQQEQEQQSSNNKNKNNNHHHHDNNNNNNGNKKNMDTSNNVNSQQNVKATKIRQVYVHVLNVRQMAIVRSVKLVVQHDDERNGAGNTCCNVESTHVQQANNNNDNNTVIIEAAAIDIHKHQNNGENRIGSVCGQQVIVGIDAAETTTTRRRQEKHGLINAIVDQVNNDMIRSKDKEGTEKKVEEEEEEEEEDNDNNVIVLQPGSRAKVRFEFTKRPEYVRPGMRLMFRSDGRVRGVGLVTSIPAPTASAQLD